VFSFQASVDKVNDRRKLIKPQKQGLKAHAAPRLQTDYLPQREKTTIFLFLRCETEKYQPKSNQS